MLNTTIKTKKPIILITTKNNNTNKKYLQKITKIATRKNYKNNIPIIKTSTHKNINIKQTFLILTHIINKNKRRPIITPYINTFKQRQKIKKITIETYKNLLRIHITNPKTIFKSYLKKLKKKPNFNHYIKLLKTKNTKKLFRQHTKQLRENQIKKKKQIFSTKLPNLIQRFLPNLKTIKNKYTYYNSNYSNIKYITNISNIYKILKQYNYFYPNH